jgi:lipopolysaccharide export system protein LptA
MQVEEGVFQQNAFIDRENQYIEGDSLYYNGSDGLYIAKDNVLIRDTSRQLEFTGGFAKSFENNRYGYITDHALAKNYDEKGDTLYLHADSLFNYVDTLNDTRLILAYKGVKLFKLDMQGVCDSLSYEKETGEMNMFYDPVLWAKNAQLSADSMTVFEKKNDIDRAYLRLNALVVTEVDTGKYYNQITGKTLNAYFDSTQIRRVDINGNAQTVYFMEEEKEEDTVIAIERSGMNRIYSSNISLFFEQGDIYAATYREEPDGKMYPMDQIDSKEEKVDGFKWNNSRRPISWYTMIMTEEERKEWDKHQQERKRLLQPVSLVSNKELKEQELIRADQWIAKYVQENYNFLTDSVFDKSDSLFPFELSQDLRDKGEWIKITGNKIIYEVQRMQFEMLGDTTFLDSICSSEDLLYYMANNHQGVGFESSLPDSLRFNELLKHMDNWVDTLYRLIDTTVVRENIKAYLQKERLSQLKNGPKQTIKDTLLDNPMVSDSSNFYSDSLHRTMESDLSLYKDTMMVDSLSNASVMIKDNEPMNDTLKDSIKLEELSVMDKKMLRLERLLNQVKNGVIHLEKDQSKKEYVLFLERLKVDLINIQRMALLYCAEELQQRVLHWSISIENTQNDKNENEVQEADEENPFSEVSPPSE